MNLNYRPVNGIIPGKVYGEYSAPDKVMTLPEKQRVFSKKMNGYRGCWHRQEPIDPEYGYKYSGGLGTYSCKHSPMAVYSPEAHKTFFVWGGAGSVPVASEERWDFSPEMIYHMVSYYDHKTGMVPKPTIVLDKFCGDAHDNPVISLDKEGYIWVFSPSHGEWTTRSYIHRSTEPYSIDHFETVSQNLFAYPQVHYAPGRGFLFMHTNYHEGRGLRVAQSPDGRCWSAPADLARFGQGHYQVTRYAAGKLGSAFDYHPEEGGLDWRTNLYYMESADGGSTWTTVDGRPLKMPLSSVKNPAMIRDYEAKGLKVYLKDIQYDSKGRPVILYITSRGWQSGPDYGPRTWRLARWTGNEWVFNRITESGNNYDYGSLYIEPDGTYRIIGATEDGPEKWNPGGEVAAWESRDEGSAWSIKKQLTAGSPYNHTFVRQPVGAHPDFYAYWADGATGVRSDSRLYFCNQAGDVFRLPFEMNDEFAAPQKM